MLLIKNLNIFLLNLAKVVNKKTYFKCTIEISKRKDIFRCSIKVLKLFTGNLQTKDIYSTN